MIWKAYVGEFGNKKHDIRLSPDFGVVMGYPLISLSNYPYEYIQ